MTPEIARRDVAAITPDLGDLADPASPGAMLALLRRLFAIGRRDLPLGRLAEGHVDALQIVMRYGNTAQKAYARRAARTGAAFGVWNADLPGEPATFDGAALSGGKAFASGAGILSHALVTVGNGCDRQLLLVDLDRTPPAVDRSWWRVSGMQRSETHVVRWQGVALDADTVIGAPGDYAREPWFSGGALRFAAVQAGGIAAIVEAAREHLVSTRRHEDPHQRSRLAEMHRHAQSAADAVRRAGEAGPSGTGSVPTSIAAARVAVYAAGEAVIALAQAAVGVQAMFVDHPIAAPLADLAVYLRQPGPDAQREIVGAAVAAGDLIPTL